MRKTVAKIFVQQTILLNTNLIMDQILFRVDQLIGASSCRAKSRKWTMNTCMYFKFSIQRVFCVIFTGQTWENSITHFTFYNDTIEQNTKLIVLIIFSVKNENQFYEIQILWNFLRFNELLTKKLKLNIYFTIFLFLSFLVFSLVHARHREGEHQNSRTAAGCAWRNSAEDS